MNTELLENPTSATATLTPAPTLRSRMLKLSAPVNVTLSQGGRLLGFDGNGKVTDRIGLGTVILTVAATPDYSMLGVTIDETQHTPTKLKDEGDANTGAIYRKSIRIQKTPDGKFYPDPKEANLRWVEISPRITANAGQPDEEHGIFIELVVASLVAQKGQFFLTYQSMVSTEAVVWQGTVKIPEMRRSKTWQALGKYLEMELGDLIGQLPFREREELSAPKLNEYDHALAAGLPNNEGIVDWYSLRRQYGDVLTNRGPARCHWSKIQTQRLDGLQYLLGGERVTFEGIGKANPPKQTFKDPKQLQRVPPRKTGFEWEIQGVKVVA